MGLIRDSLASALGADKVKTGFNGPKVPFMNDNKQAYRQGNTDNMNRPQQYNTAIPQSTESTYSRSRQPSNYGPSLGPNYQADCPSYESAVDTRNHNDWQERGYDDYGYTLGQGQTQSRSFRDQGPFNSTANSNSSFRLLALPQIAQGEGQPFLRGYSNDLLHYQISQDTFLEVLDKINVAVIPNPEVQIFQKGANIAGFFIPGAGGLALMAGQFGVGIGAAFGHASLLSRVLAKANLQVFLPQGLEICIGKTKDVNAQLGLDPSYTQLSSNPNDPSSKVRSYGNLLAPLTSIFPPLENIGRTDPLAKIGKSIGDRSNAKKASRASKDAEKAEKKGRKGKGDGKSAERANKAEQGTGWVMVRQATPDTLRHWQAMEQEQRQYDAEASQSQH